MKTPFERLRNLIADLAHAKIDALLITHPANWFYLTGFTGESGALVVSGTGAALVTDGRFVVQAREETNGIRIRQQEGSLLESVTRLLGDLRARRVGFDPIHTTVSQLQAAQKASGGRLEWVSVAGAVETLRMRKDAGELAQMRKAAILDGEVGWCGSGLLRRGVVG